LINNSYVSTFGVAINNRGTLQVVAYPRVWATSESKRVEPSGALCVHWASVSIHPRCKPQTILDKKEPGYKIATGFPFFEKLKSTNVEYW